MKYNREECIAECFKWEGGYTNHPSDPGGPTNWGITIEDARKYWKSNATSADVRAMPKSVAYNIYTQKYWKTPYYDCDTLASGVDLSTFDFGVNSGPSRAKKYLDKSVGGTDAETIIRLNDARLAFLQGLGTWSSFGKGWTRRVRGIKAKSLEMNKRKPPVSTATKTGGAIASTAAAGYGLWHYFSDFITTHRIGLIMAAGALILIGAGITYLRRKKTNV